ncbi:MAG: DNA recombination protein RmuC [Christensenellales bacterium]
MNEYILIAALANILLTAAAICVLFSKNKRQTDNTAALSHMQSALSALLGDIKKQNAENAYLQRKEVREMFGALGDNFTKTLGGMAASSTLNMENLRKTVERQLKDMSDANEKRLEQMRRAVDEQLSDMLQKRLTGSFKQVSDQLEQVFVSMGEVRTLAAGVGDLKRVLSNVKVRGTWGETQLGSLLAAMLSPVQYVKDANIGKGREFVEYAVVLPGSGGETLLLPIDSKFPMEDCIRKDEMLASGDKEQAKEALKNLGKSLVNEAKRIRDKYIRPPDTTDFAIMYLPTEGLYADAITLGIFDICQREYNVTIAGPSTLTALLSSLQMGFRTLAIEKRSGEVLRLLELTKTAFSGFTDAIDRTQRNLAAAQNNLENASKKSRRIEKELACLEGFDKMALK